MGSVPSVGLPALHMIWSLETMVLKILLEQSPLPEFVVQLRDGGGGS